MQVMVDRQMREVGVGHPQRRILRPFFAIPCPKNLRLYCLKDSVNTVVRLEADQCKVCITSPSLSTCVITQWWNLPGLPSLFNILQKWSKTEGWPHSQTDATGLGMRQCKLILPVSVSLLMHRHAECTPFLVISLTTLPQCQSVFLSHKMLTCN